MVQVHHGPVAFFFTFGGIAQLVERCFCTAEVSGSIPLISRHFVNLVKYLWAYVGFLGT